MSYRMIVRAENEIRSYRTDSWTPFAAAASLAAEPTDFAELAHSINRYLPKFEMNAAHDTISTLSKLDTTGNWVLLDLTGRTIVSSVKGFMPDYGTYGVELEDDEEETFFGSDQVTFRLSNDWTVVDVPTTPNWLNLVEERAVDPPLWIRINLRHVLLGDPLLDFICCETLIRTQKGTAEFSEEARKKAIKDIHVAWLMTNRCDLDGHTPRELMHMYRESIDEDLQDRFRQTNHEEEMPEPLPNTSRQYLHGGFGIGQICVYYDLVRFLIEDAWQYCYTSDNHSCLFDRLREQQHTFLNSSYDGEPYTAMDVIESERSRTLLSSDARHDDCDCPICLNMPSGGFCFFDGHHLDLMGEFAFSTFADKSEWECAEEYWRESMESLSSEPDDLALEQTSVEMIKNPSELENIIGAAASAWESSYINWDFLEEIGSFSLTVRALGGPLAELIDGIKSRSSDRTHVEELNSLYGQLCNADSANNASACHAELNSMLEGIAVKYPELVTKCADLQSRLDEVFRKYSTA